MWPMGLSTPCSLVSLICMPELCGGGAPPPPPLSPPLPERVVTAEPALSLCSQLNGMVTSVLASSAQTTTVWLLSAPTLRSALLWDRPPLYLRKHRSTLFSPMEPCLSKGEVLPPYFAGERQATETRP